LSIRATYYKKNTSYLICKRIAVLVWVLYHFHSNVNAQSIQELSSGWKCQVASDVKAAGTILSNRAYPLDKWMRAVVPGTVLTTLIENNLVSDPFFGLNNEHIHDINKLGKEAYTFWFVNDFNSTYAKGKQYWLHLRGVNYRCNIYLNGHLVNEQSNVGMFLRHTYNITPYLATNGKNRIAIIVYPPDFVGNANGGQGGDGIIAKNVASQYTAGWDWIRPIRDRNTGIWDKVWIESSGNIHIKEPHVITIVPGIRTPAGVQGPAIIQSTVELENPTDNIISGTIQYKLGNDLIRKKVSIAAHTTFLAELPEYTIKNPRLWWPNGYGRQEMYHVNFHFLEDDKVLSDEKQVTFGIRDIQATWNAHTLSRQIAVNGQKIFIKGGNWILSDALLRLSSQRYDDEVRFHRDMNLNLIRVWGGGITERPEFYDACDKYGILVLQDFWVSGDCNGRWQDSLKVEDTLTRRQYPDDHKLFVTSIADQVKMLRNHPSMAIWCGGNEIKPPLDILKSIRDSILPILDGTRYFFDFSNSDSMSYHSGDGPYTIQDPKSFWEYKNFPFNSEVGSIGIGDYKSLERFLPKENLIPPYYNLAQKKWIVDSVWEYHKYISYDSSVEAYRHPTTIQDFTSNAQLVNYNQYRSLIEGFSSHMWDWYTGVIIWKTQNPWTAMRGQMYDTYLDPNASLFALRHASEPIHIMYDPIDSSIMVVNNSFKQQHLKAIVNAYDTKGNKQVLSESDVNINASSCKKTISIIQQLKSMKPAFLLLRLLNDKDRAVSNNFYWLSDSNGNYPYLQQLYRANITVTAHTLNSGKIKVEIINSKNGPVSFFNRLSLVDLATKKRILPVFYTDNYISILPGERKTIFIDYWSTTAKTELAIEGYNLPETYFKIQN